MTARPEPEELPRLALSIRQPWAWAIVNAGKDIENRQWHTSFRGPICIHAAKGMARDEYSDAAGFIGRTMDQPSFDVIFARGGITPPPDRLERGGIIGTARVVDCVNGHDSPWFFGRWGFVLADVRPVPFIPVRGALGFFPWRPADASEDRNDG